jgi:hypothetical protein
MYRRDESGLLLQYRYPDRADLFRKAKVSKKLETDPSPEGIPPYLVQLYEEQRIPLSYLQPLAEVADRFRHLSLRLAGDRPGLLTEAPILPDQERNPLSQPEDDPAETQQTQPESRPIWLISPGRIAHPHGRIAHPHGRSNPAARAQPKGRAL